MSKNSQNTMLDNSIIKALENHEVAFNVADWDRMESRLAKNSRQVPLGKSYIPIISISGGVLLLFILLYSIFSSSDKVPLNENKEPEVIPNTELPASIVGTVDSIHQKDTINTSTEIKPERKAHKKEERVELEKTKEAIITNQLVDSSLFIDTSEKLFNPELKTFETGKRKAGKKIETEMESIKQIKRDDLPEDTLRPSSEKKEGLFKNIFKKNAPNDASSQKDSVPQNTVIIDTTSTILKKIPLGPVPIDTTKIPLN